MDRNMVDAARGGALMDKIQRLENQLTKLTSLVRKLAVRQHQQNMQRVCEICTSVEHPTDMCPTLQETKPESTKCIGVVGGGYQYGRQSYQNRREHAGFESKQLSIARSKIPSTVIPPTIATTSAISRKFFHNGRLDETNGRMTVGRHYKPDAVSWFRKHPLTGDSEFENGGVGVMTLQSGRELPQQDAPQPNLIPTKAETELEPIPEYNNQSEASHCHFPPEQSRQGGPRPMKIC
ncbi:hypothetical protein CR513_30400, partial [Mucuna pruriens]